MEAQCYLGNPGLTVNKKELIERSKTLTQRQQELAQVQVKDPDWTELRHRGQVQQAPLSVERQTTQNEAPQKRKGDPWTKNAGS